MPKTVEIEIFKFDELSESAKETARNWWRDGNLDYEWYDSTFEDFARICDIIGVEFTTKTVNLYGGGTRKEPDINFTVCSRGEFVSFSGWYMYKKQSAKKIREYAPTDEELHRIVDELVNVQKPAFYGLGAVISKGWRGTSIEVESEHDERESTEHEQDVIESAIQDLGAWLLRQLESEFEYLMSDEHIDESIRINEYEFNKDGSIFH